MISVDEIYIGISRWTEEDGIARCASYEGVRCGIAGAGVSFDFDDASSEKFAALPADEDFAEQLGTDDAGVAVVERARKGVLEGIDHPVRPQIATLIDLDNALARTSAA